MWEYVSFSCHLCTLNLSANCKYKYMNEWPFLFMTKSWLCPRAGVGVSYKRSHFYLNIWCHLIYVERLFVLDVVVRRHFGVFTCELIFLLTSEMKTVEPRLLVLYSGFTLMLVANPFRWKTIKVPTLPRLMCLTLNSVKWQCFWSTCISFHKIQNFDIKTHKTQDVNINEDLLK